MGKGSSPRPIIIDREVFESNFDRIFGKKSKCNYPDCKCPFDAPSDPNWCALGLPKEKHESR